MAPDYTAMKTELPKLKAKLTRAKKTGNPEDVIFACDYAFARFDVIGWPDNWHMFQNARDDAEYKLRRMG